MTEPVADVDVALVASFDQLRVTVQRATDHVGNRSDMRTALARFLRDLASELVPPPSIHDVDLAFDATLAIFRAVASDKREAIFDALGLANIRDPDARRHSRELLAGVLADLAETLRVLPSA